MNEIYLIGLGNPGKKYSNSRHNIGFLILENFSRKHNSSFLLKDKLRSSFSEFKINDSTYRLFLPNTFMNNSGDAVRAIVDWYKINLDQLFIIVDDKDLPLGKIRFRKKGSSGGHNGLKSIIENINQSLHPRGDVWGALWRQDGAHERQKEPQEAPRWLTWLKMGQRGSKMKSQIL